jgi:hypothetical protein
MKGLSKSIATRKFRLPRKEKKRFLKFLFSNVGFELPKKTKIKFLKHIATRKTK